MLELTKILRMAYIIIILAGGFSVKTLDFRGYKSQKVLDFFCEICKIPHGSGNEKQLSDYLVQFAKERNLSVTQDEAYNVLIKKDGAVDSKPVIMQAHIDMVCEKDADIEHDFFKDPIKVKVRGDMLMAEGTTLGADNGIGVAYAMAVLDSKDLKHPPLEVIFTTGEETGMQGAEAFDASQIKGKRLINLDSEEEGIFCCGCAGGIRAEVSFPITYEELPESHVSYRIKVSGLIGGHSGVDIILERANANRILARILQSIKKISDIRINEFNGGSLDNVIPRDSYCVVSFGAEKLDEIIQNVLQCAENFKKEFRVSESDVNVQIEKVTTITKAFDKTTTDKAISSLLLIPNGIQAMSLDISGLVETSANIGVVRTDKDTFSIKCLIRSSVISRKYMVLEQVEAFADAIGATIKTSGNYPSWEYKEDSELRNIFTDVYKELYNVEPKINILHAGLECGLFGSKIEDLDAISIGPDTFMVHSPDEHIILTSVERTWCYLVEVFNTLCTR